MRRWSLFNNTANRNILLDAVALVFKEFVNIEGCEQSSKTFFFVIVVYFLGYRKLRLGEYRECESFWRLKIPRSTLRTLENCHF